MNNPYKIIYELREDIAELSERCREQEADIEELLKEREWISVKDRLPEKRDNYLTVYRCKHSGGIFVGTDWFIPDCGYFCKEAPWNNSQTLYWMPLPEPPESEDDVE